MVNLNLHELFSLFIIPFSLVIFGAEYLSDSYITHSEIKIGILDYLHHLVVIMVNTGCLLSLFLTNNLIFISLVVIIYTIAQMGYIANKEYCWLTTHISKLIDPKRPLRKWRGGVNSLLRHYFRGDDWAYSDIKYINNDSKNITVNTILILALIKIIIINKTSR
jgi:hypothetical protein